MEKMIMVNHKMNLSSLDLNGYIKKLEPYKDDFVIFPSALHVFSFLKKGFKVGVQNIYCHDCGNYTGEISPKQAYDMGVSYAMIGHQERREIFEETDFDINAKVKKALAAGLKVVLCVGEIDKKSYKSIIKKQITLGLAGVFDEIIISYEPLWAIGTGHAANCEHITEVINYIKSLFNYDVLVLYGGSVNDESIDEIINTPVSGFLIGTYGLRAENLIKFREVVK